MIFIFKRQRSVESSTFEEEFVAAMHAVEHYKTLRQQLKMLGVNMVQTSDIFSDNPSLVIQNSQPSSVFNKKNLSIK